MPDFTAPINPERISSTIKLSDLNLSPDGRRVIYVRQEICIKDECSVAISSIWLTEMDEPGNGRQLSSTVEQASMPQFHPDGERIIYLSNPHQRGGNLQLHSLNISENPNAPLLCGESKPQGVILFSISPDGEHVAFTSTDEPIGKRNINTVRVYGQEVDFERLHVYTFATGDVRTLGPSQSQEHVNGFVWSPDSHEILFYTWPTAGPECRESSMPSDEKTISIYITSTNGGSSPRCVGHYNQTPGQWERQSFVWPTESQVVDIAKFDPLYRQVDGLATHWHSLDNFDSPICGGGETDNPNSLIDIRFNGLVAILTQKGTSTAIEIWKGGKYLETLLELYDDAPSTCSGCWDIKRLFDGTFRVAIIKSSAIHYQPEEIWISSNDGKNKLSFDIPITTHQNALAGSGIKTSIIDWENSGITLQGTISYPPNYSPGSALLPVILFIHSGPYDRTTASFKLDKFRLQLFLASHGYLVLSPNYRGSSGRGSSFARVSGSQLVTKSWSDCDSMVDHAIALQLADPDRLALAGHSSGGYLAALGATITKRKYKAAIVWSGASDPSSLAGTSLTPEFQFSISGLAPWYAESENLVRDSRGAHPSPVRNLEGVETSFLILHGEEDPQIPVGQAVILYRGLKRLSKFPGLHKLAVYPCEGHVLAEKGHWDDALKRILGHLGEHLL